MHSGLALHSKFKIKHLKLQRSCIIPPVITLCCLLTRSRLTAIDVNAPPAFTLLRSTALCACPKDLQAFGLFRPSGTSLYSCPNHLQASGGFVKTLILLKGAKRSEGEFVKIGFEIDEVAGENGVENFGLNPLVVVDGDVTKSNHVLHGFRAWLSDESMGSEDVEGVAAVLRDAKVPDSDPMHGKVDGCLAGAQQVEDDGILDGEVFKA